MTTKKIAPASAAPAPVLSSLRRIRMPDAVSAAALQKVMDSAPWGMANKELGELIKLGLKARKLI